MTEQTASLPILTAVNVMFQKIREFNPDVPNAVIVVGSSGRQRRGQVHGHFAPTSWHGEQHEIFLSGESLARGAEATLGTLIHESAHALAHAQEIKDTSNNGRYHNKKFKFIAETLGITLEQADTIGWSVTSVPDETLGRYRDEVIGLSLALTTWREPKPQPDKEKKPTEKRNIKIHCECDEGTTVSKKWWEAHQGTVKCDDCLTDFVADEEE
jgi:hypothetical protein